MAAIDSIGYCLLALPTKTPAFLPIVARLISARYGRDLTPDDIMAIGVTTIKQELAFNRGAGFAKDADRIPDFIKAEPLPPQNTVFDVPMDEIRGIWRSL